MRLYEFQAKRFLAQAGIEIPNGVLLTSAEQAAELAFPAILKAQVPIGGRGKEGGIQIVSDLAQAEAIARELLGAEIRGYRVQAILAEEVATVRRELYLAVLLDRGTNQVMVVASADGGVEIEQAAEQNPERIVKKALSPFLGLPQFTTRYVAKALGIEDVQRFGAILQGMVDILWEFDATLVEINPLAETPNGLLALDAKIVLDDKAAYRHADLVARLKKEHRELDQTDRTRAERLAEERNITYVLLDGNVGLITDGAGTGMLALDMIQDAGGRPANFCEMGGLASPDVMRQSIEVVLANPRVKALLIALIGGLTRMDEMAEGIVQYVEAHGAMVPTVIRMAGTRAEVGRATLKGAGIEAFEELPVAVQSVVGLARED